MRCPTYSQVTTTWPEIKQFEIQLGLTCNHRSHISPPNLENKESLTLSLREAAHSGSCVLVMGRVAAVSGSPINCIKL